jgi:outer membrane protein assembly factor BamB
MRTFWCLTVCVALGSGCDSARPAVGQPPQSTVGAAAGATSPDGSSVAIRDQAVRPASPEETLPSLWTRQRGEDWPRFLGPAGNSKSAESGLVVPWPNGGPRVVWAKEVGTGYGIGSIAAGRYYQFDRHDLRRGRGQARLTCLNAETGEEIWRFEYPCEYEDMLGYNNGPRASPVIDGNRVYIYGVEGMLHCLAAQDGTLIWKVDTAAKFGVVQNFFGVGSTPAVFEDLLICMVGGSPPGSRGLYESYGGVDGNGTGIVAFDKWSGAVRYAITDELASYASPQLATIDGRSWCFMFCRGGLVGFEPRTGKVDFHYPWRSQLLESVNAATPVIVGNQVFISETYQIGSSLLAVKPGGYDLVWHDERKSRDKAFLAHWNTPIEVDGYLYGCSGRNPPDAELRCIDWKTGAVKWKEAVSCRASLMFVDGYFLALFENGELQLFRPNPQRFELVSRVSLRPQRFQDLALADQGPLPGDPYWAAPILSHGLMYARGDNRLVCLELIPEGTR